MHRTTPAKPSEPVDPPSFANDQGAARPGGYP